MLTVEDAFGDATEFFVHRYAGSKILCVLPFEYVTRVSEMPIWVGAYVTNVHVKWRLLILWQSATEVMLKWRISAELLALPNSF